MKNNNIYKIILFILLILVIQASAVELVVSTETDNVYLDHDSPEVNISIREPDLEEFKFNWDGTNYSFYDSSLVLAMNFNNNSAIGENASKTVDISKYGNNGTIYGAAWTSEGRFAGAMQFNGVDNYVDARNGTSLDMDSNDFTVEAWVKSINSTYGRGIVSKGSWSNIGYFISNAYNPANGLYFGIRDSAGYKYALFLKNSTYDWTHLVGIKTNNHLETWVNGVKMNEYNGPIGSISNPGLPLTIGKSPNGYYFNGSIDEVRIWNRALSPGEIKMHYQSEFQKYNVTEWRFYDNISWCQCGREKFGSDLNPTGDPIGGGKGYSRIISASSAKYIVNNKSELLYALSTAVGGDVIYVNDSAEIDLTLERDLVIPANVTLASGRGRAGSSGALLYSNNISIGTGNTSETFQLFKTGGNGVRVTGLRLQGPDTEIGNSAYEFSNSRGIYSVHDVEVDNSELSGWSHCAVCLYYTPGSVTPYIHHNFIHHNRRSGLGYGVVLAYGANSMIEANIFDWNRHSIAGDGRINTSYTARYNLVLGNGNGHSFDMHGGADRNDGTNIAGKTINIYSNTFYNVSNINNSYPAVVIRGIPTNGSWIHDNYFYYDLQEYAIRQTNAVGNVEIYDNSYNGYLDHIADGAYTYYGWASDILGNSNSSEIRTITVNRGNYNPTGRVLNASSGLGIPGAQVKLDANQQYNTTTNILGDYSMSIPAGTYNVSASASGYATNTTTLAINANIVQNFSLSADIPDIIYINGTVNDRLSKTGIPGVSVSTNTSLSTTTNATGLYSFAVTPGTYDLTAKIDPIYYANNTITTIGKAFVIQEIELLKKPTGKISGSVTR